VGARGKVIGFARPPKRSVVSEDQEGGRFEPSTPDVEFDGVTFRDVDLSGTRFWQLYAAGSRFERCAFNNVKIEHGALSGQPRSVFVECDFGGADLRSVEPGHARFERCSFEGSKIEGWFAYCAEFVECVFSGEIVRSRFSGTPFECGGLFSRLFGSRRLEFRGNDFRRARLVDTEFANGVDLDAQLLPVDGYVRIDDALTRIEEALRVVAEWPNEHARRVVTNALETLADTAHDQRDLFVASDEFPKLPTDLREEMWRLLRDVSAR
jgi:Pentapeptide repeats (9 copies)